jgi:hypothetical protein
MRTLRFTFLLLMGISGILVFAGCAASPIPEPTPIPLPTETAEPTATLTSEPTATATITPTATVTLVPTPDLTGIEVLGAGPESGFYLVNFYKPGIDKEYLVQTDSGIPFKCNIYKEAYPDRLICHGPMLSWGEKVQFSFIDPDTAQTVYALDYILPDRDYGFAEKKLYWCVHPDACPLRGQQMNCETEIRKDSHGKPCLWSTCIDLCGYCTSINTCDNQ